jgi:hypothetical protein
VAGVPDQLELRVPLAELDERGMRRRLDRDDPRSRARRPVEQQARQIACVRADLGHGPRSARVETPRQDLTEVRQRVTPPLGVVPVRVGFGLPGHRGQRTRFRKPPGLNVTP